MLGEREGRSDEIFVACSLRDLIPEDYILKKVDRVLDLSWLREDVAEVYCEDNGRPSIDPECAVRLMLAGFFLGIVHDRRLMREARMHVGIRWFIGYALHDRLPDHSSLTRLRQRWGAERFKRIFERTVAQCAKAGLVGGDTVHVDATLIRADVSWESLTREHANQVIEANEEARDEKSNDDPPAPRKGGRPRTKELKPKKRSKTDPDCTLTTSSKEFRMIPSYKQHTAVDDATGVVLDAEITTGEQNEGQLLLEQVDRVEKRLGCSPGQITADGSYAHGRNWEGLEQRRIDAVIPPQKVTGGKAVPASKFKFDARHQQLTCPRGQKLKRNPPGAAKLVFRSIRRKCLACPIREDCVNAVTGLRVLTIVEGHEAMTRARRRYARQEAADVRIYNRHRWIVEGRHGEAKTQHGLRRAVRRGLDNVRIQAYLTAAVMNLKRLVRVNGWTGKGPGNGSDTPRGSTQAAIAAIFITMVTISELIRRSERTFGHQFKFSLS